MVHAVVNAGVAGAMIVPRCFPDEEDFMRASFLMPAPSRCGGTILREPTLPGLRSGSDEPARLAVEARPHAITSI
jgi:hypothetical protein